MKITPEELDAAADEAAADIPGFRYMIESLRKWKAGHEVLESAYLDVALGTCDLLLALATMQVGSMHVGYVLGRRQSEVESLERLVK